MMLAETSTPTLKIKKLVPNAIVPEMATPGSAGMDLTAISLDMEVLESCQHLQYARAAYKYIYGTGLALEIPFGYVGLIYPRSSIHKTDMQLSNCVGVIDSDYRGEVKFVFTVRHHGEKIYEIGDRIGQLVIMQLPFVRINVVDELSQTVRGTGGFGSTGR